MGGLYNFTFGFNLLSLILTIWLGIYLVARSSRYGLAWLSSLTLWSLGGLFLNLLLALDPPQAAAWPAGLRLLFGLWPDCAIAGQAACWLEGWMFVPALAFWHHVTILMLPGKMTLFRLGRILVVYLGVAGAILIQAGTPILYTIPGSDPLYISSLKTGPLYPIFVAGLVITTLASLANLLRAAVATPESLLRKRLWVLSWATLVGGLVGPLSIAGSGFQQPVPMVAFSLVIAIPVALFGYGVLSYSAAMEGRTLRRDFLYTLALLVLVILVYLLVGWILVTYFQAPASLIYILPVLAVISHSLIQPAYRLMDRLFFEPSARQMRSSLRHLMRLAGEGRAVENNLAEALKSLCASVQASYGLVLLCEGAVVRRAAAFHFNASLSGLRCADFSSDDVQVPRPGQLGEPLADAALLIPLYVEDSQLGALVLGSPVNGTEYPELEVERLLELSDQISDVIYISQLKTRTIRRVVELAESQRRPPPNPDPQVPPDLVESALRSLHDYAFLADSPLARLALVQSRLAEKEFTHLERGKIVQGILLEALEKLCPPAHAPRNPPPREWHPYLILRSAYQEETPNREIMARLYISEGTFNRTRRQAIRSVARALGEMEAAQGLV